MTKGFLAYVIFVNLIKCIMTLKLIVGGYMGHIEDFPFSAALHIKCGPDYEVSDSEYGCGSSIINQDILLTAAHCLWECSQTRSHIMVTIGQDNRDIVDGRFQASKFIIHQEYSPKPINNDIAIVGLKKSLQFGPTVSRVVLMENPPSGNAVRATAAGWGLLSEGPDIRSPTLRFLPNLRVRSAKTCASVLGNIGKGTICAGNHKDDNEFVAPGDSGSALVVQKLIQIGIVSYKIPDTSSGFAVYTEIAYHFKWIQRNAKVLYCDLKI